MKTVKKLFVVFAMFGLALTGCSASGQQSSNATDMRYAIYQLAKADGYEGTYEQWLASIKGEKGDKGDKGDTPEITIGKDGYWYIDDNNTNVKAQGDQGPKGDKGATGSQGPQGDKGDKGDTGDTGDQGPQGDKGDKGDKGDTGDQGPQGDKGDKGDKGDIGETGLSAYEIFLKYHPDYAGSEEDWINDIAEGNHCSLFGHDYKVVVTPATCLEGGFTTKTCSYCGDVQITDPTPALGHDYTNSNCCIRCGQGEVSQGLDFTLSGDESYYILSGIGTCDDRDIIVPSYHNGLPVKEIGNNAFKDNLVITSVLVDIYVTRIGNNAFYGCVSLKTVNFTDYLEEIGSSAFEGCVKFQNFKFPASIKGLGGRAFCNCDSLTRADITVKAWNAYGWGMYLFANCDNLVTVSIEKGTDAFRGYPFSGSNNITYILFNGTKAEWDAILYKEDSPLETATVIYEYESGFVDEGDYTYYLNGDTVEYLSINNKEITDFDFATVFPSYKFGSFAPRTFKNCSKLKTVTLGNGITEIYESMFEGCTALESISIPDSVISIGKRAFYQCSSLTNVVFPNDVRAINESAFEWCSSLQSITLGSKVNSIGKAAFNECSALNNVIIPESVKAIGESAFRRCTALTEIRFDGRIDVLGNDIFGYTWDKNTFFVSVHDADYDYYCAYENEAWQTYCVNKGHIINIENTTPSEGLEMLDNGDGTYTVLGIGTCTDKIIVLPSNVTSIADEAFASNNSIIRVVLNQELKTLGSKCFYNCKSLQKVIFNEGLEVIGTYSFFSCGALTDVIIPKSVTSIGNDAFMYVSGSIQLQDDSQLVELGAYAFSQCTFTSINLPATLKTIGQCCFESCANLKTIDLKNVESLGYHCFNSCTRLESMIIGRSMTSIGTLAGDCGLSSCTSLRYIYYYGMESEWNNISLNKEKATIESKGLYFFSGTTPNGAGNYWHYVDGVPTVW